MRESRTFRLLALAGLLLLHFLIRWQLSQSPLLDQADYDESITGLMALHWLRGDFQAFFWGQPYMGTLEPLLAALVFWLFGPSTQALHTTLILVGSLTLLAVYGLGVEVKDYRLGLTAALFWALPPLFLTFNGLYATGGHLEAITAAAVVLYGVCRLAFRPPRRELPFALGIGLAAGLGWWCSLLVASLLAASAVGLLVARPRLLRGWIPWIMLGGFLLGSAPFWWWNLTHDFMTFRAVEPGSGHILKNLLNVGLAVVLPTLLGAWWDGWSVQTSIPRPAIWGLILLVYLPVLLLTLGIAGRWFFRLLRRRWPLQNPLDLVAAALVAAMLAHALSSYGATGFTRYAQSIFVSLAVLTGVWLQTVWRWRKAVGLAMLAGLCIYNLNTHYLFLQEAQKNTKRPVDGLIAELRALGITHAYAQGRIAYPITFESAESIICSDYFGWRNYAYLGAVDSADRIALITHQKLGNPRPRDMAAGLAMIGAQAQRGADGDYVYWHDFRPPPPSQPLSSHGWHIIASNGERGLERSLADRDISTTWTLAGHPDTWLAIDLGQTVEATGITLLPNPEAPLSASQLVGLRLASSLDGENWEPAVQGFCLAGLVWERGQPRLRDSKAMEIDFAPRPTRYLRLFFEPSPDQVSQWPLAEIFVHQLAPGGGYQAPPRAREAFQQAQDELRPWFVEPMGPHPRFPGVPSDYRSSRVDWAAWVSSLRRAMLAAPDWERPYRMMLQWFSASPLTYREVWPDWRALVLEGEKCTAVPASMTSLALVFGDGSLGVRQGLGIRKWEVSQGSGEVVSLGNSANVSGLVKVVRAEGLKGQPCLQALRTPLEAAQAYIRTGQKKLAAAWLDREQAGGRGQESPAELLERALYLSRLSRIEPAAEALANLGNMHPELLEALSKATPGLLPPWPVTWWELSGHDKWLWRHHMFSLPAVEANHDGGQAVSCPEAQSGVVWRLDFTKSTEQTIKVWFPQFFLRGRYIVSFRVRGLATPDTPFAAFSVVRHHLNRLYDEPARVEWSSGGQDGLFQDVVLPVETDLEPVKLEARAFGIGPGVLEVDNISICPDLGWELASKLTELNNALARVGGLPAITSSNRR